jgi:small-conductance mechanosensitive channel
MSERTQQAIVTAAVGLGVLIVLRIVLSFAFDRWVDRFAERRSPDAVARLRTRLAVLRKVILATVFVIVAWSVLEIFPATEELARTLLASGAIIALFIGVAFSVPLGNIGGGILLSLSQPVRLGDRISIGDVIGTAEEITLLYTVVRTDDGRTAFVPNSQMVTSTVVNRSMSNAPNSVTVRLPIGIHCSVDHARRVLLEAVAANDGAELENASVIVDDVGEHVAWLAVRGLAPDDAAADDIAAQLRERGLAVLAREGLLA